MQQNKTACYVNILLTVVEISDFYMTWEISKQFSRKDLKLMTFLVLFGLLLSKFGGS